ncbi:hypothetical protein DKX38_020576 [Salix brachista]|uniref:Uncharacterized protein n=1 Tax=Salix brachista TaxID=2182728 RepID=A0A5N5K5M3_9ROSI|nr:hypothetical protein DKX38_020576 [Salix brachista]
MHDETLTGTLSFVEFSTKENLEYLVKVGWLNYSQGRSIFVTLGHQLEKLLLQSEYDSSTRLSRKLIRGRLINLEEK